jgi:putative phosphoribosyl transferase
MNPATYFDGCVTMPVGISSGGIALEGDLAIPHGATGLVLFAHGSGSGRMSPRNRHVAEWLRRRGMATLLFDLLTEAEEQIDRQTAHLRFDIGLLASRLGAATDWSLHDDRIAHLAIGYFGASTGGAAALVAAAPRPNDVHAVVSRGGRPDLAAPVLPDVQAATLLIVGGDDRDVLALNRQAYESLKTTKKLEVVPGASHLFEEPGKLEEVANLASDWFQEYLVQRNAKPMSEHGDAKNSTAL